MTFIISVTGSLHGVFEIYFLREALTESVEHHPPSHNLITAKLACICIAIFSKVNCLFSQRADHAVKRVHGRSFPRHTHAAGPHGGGNDDPATASATLLPFGHPPPACSLVTSRASLSSRSPLNEACRTTPSEVQP